MPSSRTKDDFLRDDSAIAGFFPARNINGHNTATPVETSTDPELARKDGSPSTSDASDDITRSATQLLEATPPETPYHATDDATVRLTHRMKLPVSEPLSEPLDTDDATVRLPPLKLHNLAKDAAARRKQFRPPSFRSRSSLNISSSLTETGVPETPISVPQQKHDTQQYGQHRSLHPRPVKYSLLATDQRQSIQGDGANDGSFGEAAPEEEAAESISRLDTISMLAVQPLEEASVQQDIFINNWVEDITHQNTLRLPSVKIVMMPGQTVVAESAVESKAQEDKRKVVASTAGGAAIAGIGDLVSAMMRYITTVFMTNVFSLSVAGTFVEVNTVVTILGYASKLGLDSATLRFLAGYRTRGERSRAAGLIRFASLVALVSGLIWGASFFALSFVVAHFVFKKDVFALPFREAVLLIPLIGMQLVVASGLQAFKAIKWKVYVDRLIQPGVTLLLLIVFYLLGLRLEALILATTCGFIASTITGQFLLGKAKKKLVQNVKPEYDIRTWLKFAFPMFFNSMIRNILNSTDILFLGAVATQGELAFYGSADRVSYFVVAPLIALNAIFSPVIAEYHTRGEHKQLENMFKIVTKWSFSLSLPVFLCCVIFHDAILGIFTEKYTAAGLVLVILAFGNLVDSGVGSVNYLLVMTGRPKVILTNTVTTVVVNIMLALLLVPHFKILGAACAAALTVIILNIVGLIEVYWIMKIHPYRLDTLKPIVAGAVASVVGLLLNEIVHVGYGHRAIFGTLIGLILPFLLSYVAMLALLRFSEEDLMVFDMVRAKFGKGKKKAA
ncbi:MAG: hypothetical protein NVS4B11_20350 [Ktedonobacteraceae bacterium]